jgi:hypothetical protein
LEKGRTVKLRKMLLLATLASTTALAGAIASTAHASDFTVYTGYADNLRPSGFFPTTWLGDAGVVSDSSPFQSFDAGAIRIQNTSGSAFTVDNFKVTLNGGGGPSFSLWGSLAIGAGNNGIFTQTVAYNFDTSDYGGGVVGPIYPLDPGSNGIGGCSSTAAALGAANVAYCASVAPTVEFDIGSTHYLFTDSGHILDTGHYDFVCCAPDGNESINWNVIGGGADRGGTGVPEPATWTMLLAGFGGLGAMLRRRRYVIAA